MDLETKIIMLEQYILELEENGFNPDYIHYYREKLEELYKIKNN